MTDVRYSLVAMLRMCGNILKCAPLVDCFLSSVLRWYIRWSWERTCSLPHTDPLWLYEELEVLTKRKATTHWTEKNLEWGNTVSTQGSLEVNFWVGVAKKSLFFLAKSNECLFLMSSCWALSKGTFTLLSTFAYKVREEKTCFTLIVCSLLSGLMQTSGVLQHPLLSGSIILLRFLKTCFKFTALYLPLACTDIPLGSEEDYVVFSDTLNVYQKSHERQNTNVDLRT